MGTAWTVVLVLVVLLVLAAVAWGWTTRTALLRLRDLATSAGEQVEHQRSRRDELQAAAASTGEPGARRALADSQRRLDGDVAFHVAGVRAYNARLGRAPGSLVASVAGLHPLPEPPVAPAVPAAEVRAPEVRAPEAPAPGAPAAGEHHPGGATRAEPPRG